MKSKDGVVLWLLLINHASDLNGIRVHPKLVPVPASRYLPWPGGVVPYAFVHPAPTSRQMAAVLGYKTETIQMYADMTARDLLQQRTTTHTGDTVWRLSPLIEAALEGKMAVLDGLHRVHRGTLAVLQRLIHDREVQLYDGTRLLARDKYDLLLAEHGWTAEEMAARGVLPTQHPAFRLVAPAEPQP